jgi:hypothetical protein
MSDAGVSYLSLRDEGVFVVTPGPSPEDSLEPSSSSSGRGEAKDSTAKASVAIRTKDGSGFVISAKLGVRRFGEDQPWTGPERIFTQVCVSFVCV